MNKHKKTYINSKTNTVSVVKTSLRPQLQEKIDQLVQEKLRQFEKEIRATIEQHHDPQIPISVFKSKSSTLEIIVTYLHEIERRSFAEIADLLQRDDRTIWHAYQRALKKKVRITITHSKIAIPVSIFASRDYSPLETLAAYLKDSHQLKLNEIAVLLELSPKTVWTVYNRKQQKDVAR